METTGMRLLRGRRLGPADEGRSEVLVVVNQALVDVSFPKEDPLGRRVRLGLNSPPMTIVGVVANTPTIAFTETPVQKVYMPLLSNADGRLGPAAILLGPAIDAMSYVVRTSVTPERVLADVRRAVADVDPNLALAQVRPLQDYLDTAAAQTTFTMVLLVIAATVALLLGVVGIYGVTSYIVSQRTSEIGVRLALGAPPSSVAAMMARQGGMAALMGVVAGIAVALAGTSAIESLLFGVTARDPGVFAVTVAIVAVVALVACWIPARRAAGLSPLEALRAD
jgi:putative ABC transport system permease protein